MIEALRNKEIFEKVGGAFRLTALIQKRMVEIMEGSRPLIEDTKGKTTMEVVIEEIMQDKITVDDGTDSKPSDLPTL
ncbi:MAG: DNA-directed RNA polymerase subunit omega [Anaerohalosphaeraceae bacterium]|nr:DNA-directed RNA polymerase subunit omega [Anaerohalosphaeraceae bacterium]